MFGSLLDEFLVLLDFIVNQSLQNQIAHAIEELMEEKQLNFNQPLLSVRRFSPAVSAAETQIKRKTENGSPRVPPVYKSEFKSGPVRNPGKVPFVWEQTPGKPKFESKPQNLDQELTLAAPRLPPGRIANTDRQALDKVFEARAGVSGSENEKRESREESSGDGTEETDGLDSEDGTEAFVDARDTLSRSESFFSNCSISALSGLDGPSKTKWGTFSTDQQTRDFMMGRFLPAAKAMASETPQYCTRRQPVQQEQLRVTNRVLASDKWDPFSRGRRLTGVPQEQTEDEWNSRLNEIPFRRELDGSSLYKRLQGNAQLPYKVNLSKPAIHEEKRFLGVPEKSRVSAVSSNAKGGKLFEEILASESNEWESASSSPLAERTLYIDSVQMPKPQISNSSSPDKKGVGKHRRDEVTKVGEFEESALTYSSFAEDKIVDNTNMPIKGLRPADFGLQSLSDKSVEELKLVSVIFKHNEDSTHILTSEASPKVDPCRNQEEKSKGSKSLLPLPLPLPKSPSESWLKRALPAASSKQTALRSTMALNLQASKIDSSDSKWETIVKSTKVQHGHLRHSEELLSTIPEV